MRHRTLFFVVLALQAVCLGAQTAQTEPPGPAAGSAPRPVAVVLSQIVDTSEIERQQLSSLIQARLLDAYAKRFRLEPTEAELGPLLRSMEDAPRRVEEKMKPVRQRRLAEIRKKLEDPTLDPAERERLTADLADWERIPPNRDAEILEMNRKWVSLLVQNWKVQRSLYQRYGGRVLYSSLGFNIAIDAMKRFLQEEEKRGAFEIFDPDMRAAFWRDVADETWADGVATGRSADEFFATPPWKIKERHP